MTARPSPEPEDQSWREWLSGLPAYSGATLDSVAHFGRVVSAHLSEMPDPALLSRDEALHVSLDLLDYAQELSIEQQARIEIGFGDLLSATAGAAVAIFVPGAQIPAALFALAVVAIGARSRYQQRRRQELIERVVEQLRRIARRIRL